MGDRLTESDAAGRVDRGGEEMGFPRFGMTNILKVQRAKIAKMH
jgi:hypothetical protein